MSTAVLLIATMDAVGQARLPRILHDAGCNVTLIAPPSSAIWNTRYSVRRIPGPNNPVDAVTSLREHLSGPGSPSYKWVLALDEPLLWSLAEQEDSSWIRNWFPVDLTDRAATWTAFSKVAFAIACADAGAAVPDFVLVGSADEALHHAAIIGYPVTLKIEHGLSGSGVRIVHSPDELRYQFSQISDGAVTIVQRFVPGRVGCSPVLYDQGKPVCWYSAYLRENWPTPFASSSALEIMDHPDIAGLLQAVGSLTGFHGLAGVDWIQDPETGQVLLLELNPRPTPGTYLGPSAGVDFSRAIRSWLAGSSTTQIPIPQAAGRLLRMFPQNVYFSVDNHRFGNLVPVLRDAPWDEPRLTLAHMRRAVTHFMPESLRTMGRQLLRSNAT